MNENVIENKCFDFAVRIVNLHKHLSAEKKEFILSKQLLLSGTSIGTNVSEALKGQSKADFSAKMCIALKEANESHYWIRLLYKTDFLLRRNLTVSKMMFSNSSKFYHLYVKHQPNNSALRCKIQN